MGTGKDTPMGAYRERLGHLDDDQLKKELEAVLDAEEWGQLDAVKHEMTLRFRGLSESQKERQDARSYFWDKLLKSAEDFRDLVAAGEWFRAKYLYEQACMLTVFLEAPEGIRQQLFGATTEDDVYVDGLFDKKSVSRVMNKCIVWNRLGYDCMVYRIPGEVGYHGAKAGPGMRPERKMEKEENPAYLQEAPGQ